MKETSGEFSMTVVVIVGAIIVISLLSTLVPAMGTFISEKWQEITNSAGNGPGAITAPSMGFIISDYKLDI